MKEFSLKAKFYLFGTILLGAVVLGWNLYWLDRSNLWMVLGLSVFASLSLIFKVEGATNHSHYNISFLIYAFTFVLLGTPSAMLVILVSNLVEWAWRRYPWYIQVFNITSYAIAIQAAGLFYGWANPSLKLASWISVLAVLGSMAIFTSLNHLSVGLIVWLATGENFSKSGIFNFFPLMLDYTLGTMGAGAAFVWTVNPAGILLFLPPLYLIYSTLKVPALERQTEIDSKTGLFNARYFSKALENELSRANRFDRPMTVVMADLDLLRNINNTYGHLAGDEVLIGVAKILRGAVRDYDVVARFGGEEFCILFPETSPEEVYRHIDSIRETIQMAGFIVPTNVAPIKVTMSFGIAGRDGPGQNPKEIIHNADVALYRAKLKGRNCTSIYQSSTVGNSPAERHLEALQVGETLLEERIHAGDMPFQPNPLRETPAGSPSDPAEPKAVEAGRAKIGRSDLLLNAFIGGLALAAVLLSTLVFRPANGIGWTTLVVFAGMVILTEWLSPDIHIRDISVSTSAAPALAGILVAGPVGAVAVSLAFAAAAWIKNRSAFNRMIFNASNQLLAGYLCLGLIVLSGRPLESWPLLVQVLLTLSAAGLAYLSATLMTSIAVHLDQGVPVWRVWKEKFSRPAPYSVAMGLVAYALIFSYQTAGFAGTLIILVPLFLLRFSQRRYIQRKKAIVNELREKNLSLEQDASRIERLNDDLLEILAETVDLRHPLVLGHSRLVSHYSVIIAQKLGLPESQVELIRKAGQLHDVGKLGIPDSILLKPAPLTLDEYILIKKHVILGAEVLGAAQSMSDLIPVVRHHHERFDGRGYPDRLTAYDIPLEARIVGVADAVEAMASDRPYRQAKSIDEIVSELRKNAGAQFDPAIVEAFIEVIEENCESVIVNSSQNWAPNARSRTPVGSYLYEE